MTVYVLTESELDRLGDLTGLSAAFSSAATFFFGLWLDLLKDQSLASSIPPGTKEALRYVDPLLVILAVFFAGLAAIFWFKRHNHQSKIKHDSKSKSRVRGEVRPVPQSDDGAQGA